MDLNNLVTNTLLPQKDSDENYIGAEYETEETCIMNVDGVSKSETQDINGLTDANVNYYNNGLQIESVISSLESGYYVIPGFQRRFVWDKTKIAYLAFSIIKHIPIPPMYLYKNKEKKEVVLDGQQRMIAIYLYFNDLYYYRSDNHINFKAVSLLNGELRTLEAEKERLENEEGNKKEIKAVSKKIQDLSKLLFEKYGMRRCPYTVELESDSKDGTHREVLDISFKNFNENNRDYLLRQRVDITLVECRDLKPQKTYANIFKLLNSGGKILGPQEIRNGVYWESYLYRSLYEINEVNPSWRNVYGKISDFSKDMEILLKMLSLNHFSTISEETSRIVITKTGFSWANIMDDYSEYHANSSDDTIVQEIEPLKNYLNALDFSSCTGKSRCQKAVFESVFIAYCKLEISKERKIDYQWLCDLNFEKVLSNKTDVENRMNAAYIWLKEAIND